MVENAQEEDGVQYMFITPQDMSHVEGLCGPDAKVLKMIDPERGQQTLEFPRRN